jgi:O-Antigen ligase
MTFGLKDKWFWIGVIVFFLGRFLSDNYKVPLVELFLPTITLYYCLSRGSFALALRSPLFFPAVAFVAWGTLSCLVNDVGLASAMRKFSVLSTLFAALIFYTGIADKRNVLSFVIGCIVAFGVEFSLVAILELAQGDVSRDLRGLQPTPVVAMALYLHFGKRLTPMLRIALIMSALVSFLVAFAIDARGPLLSAIFGAGLWFFGRTKSLRMFVLPLVVVFALLANTLAGLTWNMYDRVLNSDNMTMSNAERAYAIDYSIANIDKSPWFGMSQDAFTVGFANAYDEMSVFQKNDVVESPHNSFLEYSVFFGLPSGFLFLYLVWRTLFVGARKNTTTPLVYGLILAAIIRLGAFYGVSGWIRIEWFAVLFILYDDNSEFFPTKRLRHFYDYYAHPASRPGKS